MTHPIAYLPGLAKVLGGVKATVLFCQLYYWSERANESGWFYKSQEELVAETGETVDELRAARKDLAEKGVVQSRYARIEHRLYFRIDRERLDALWLRRNGHVGNSDMAPWKIPDGDLEKTDLVRSDPETTAKITQISERNGCHPTLGPEKKEPDTQSVVTPEDLVEAWNEICVPLGMASVRELSNSRRVKALARVREHPQQSWWNLVFGRIGSSAFLQGRSRPRNGSEKPFWMRFDWLIDNDTNALKIYEGLYDG